MTAPSGCPFHGSLHFAPIACSIPIVQTIVGATVAIDNLISLIEDIYKICLQSLKVKSAESNLDQKQATSFKSGNNNGNIAFKTEFLNHLSAFCIAIISAIPIIGSLYNGAQLAYLGSLFIYEEFNFENSSLESTIKNLLSEKKYEVVEDIINRFDKNDQPGVIEIAKFCASKPNFLLKNIELFRIESRDELIKVYKACVGKGAKILLETLPYLALENEKDLIEIIRLVAMVRPDVR
ncbi:MAG: hypothetical protein H0T62_02660 [Parachlamydiaceae bacterium]|nr:hypothetical protein [Parachlamydiaceae bacterium]